jgi:SH3-like domain-containing protein
MRFRLVDRHTTRLLLTAAIVMMATRVLGAMPESPMTAQAERHGPVKSKADPGPPKRPAKPGKAQGAKGPATADPKTHPASPAVVAPVAPTPPKVPPTASSGDPGLKLPRFAALKTDETNMRRGPGQRYPIEWVYKRRDLPMQVEREYDVWRYVRDPEGIQGWVHQVTLSERRTFMVKDKDATLRADSKDTATPVATLQVGVIGRLRECDNGSNWCQVQVGGFKGYLRREQLWGLLPDEVVGPS